MLMGIEMIETNRLTLPKAELISPCGGPLVDLMEPAESADELKVYAGRLPSLILTERSVCDLELLACGAFSPLAGFTGRDDYRRVIEEMRLADGHLFPIPITLPIDAHAEVRLDSDVALRNNKNELLAVMTVTEIFPWNRDEEALGVYGSKDLRHPLVA